MNCLPTTLDVCWVLLSMLAPYSLVAYTLSSYFTIERHGNFVQYTPPSAQYLYCARSMQSSEDHGIW